MTIFSYSPKSERVLLHAHIRPLPLVNETNGHRQPTFAVPSNSALLGTGNAPAPPNLDCPAPPSRVLKPSVFLAYFSVLTTDVDR